MDVAEGRCMEDRDLENNNKSLVVPYFKRMEEPLYNWPSVSHYTATLKHI